MRRVAQTLASIASTATSPVTSVTTPDDQKTRVLRTVYMSPITAGAILEVRRAGFLQSSIDVLRFGNGNEPVYVDEIWPTGIPFQVDVINLTGGAYVPTVTLGYTTIPPVPEQAP